MGYKNQAIKGISWLGAFKAFSRSLSILRTVVVARILSPYQFGVFGLVALILSLMEILMETGVNIFLIQKRDNVEKYIDTAWILSIMRGFLLSVLIFYSAPVLSKLFDNTEVLPLLRLISSVPLIRGFINPTIVVFQKELNFRKEFNYRSSIFFVETLISILLIIIMKDPRALIYALIASSIFEVFISFKFITPTPDFKFNQKIFINILSNGKWVTSSGILAYFLQNADNFIVGKLLGANSLGIYNMGYKIAMLPVSEISDMVARVTFPVYVKIADDKNRLKKAYIKTASITLLLATPIVLVLLFFPKEIILFFLGPKWIEAENIIRVIALFAFINTLSSPTGSVFFAAGKQKYLTVLTGVSLSFMAITIIPLINYYGVIGGAISVFLSSAIAIPLQIYFTYKVLLK